MEFCKRNNLTLADCLHLLAVYKKEHQSHTDWMTFLHQQEALLRHHTGPHQKIRPKSAFQSDRNLARPNAEAAAVAASAQPAVVKELPPPSPEDSEGQDKKRKKDKKDKQEKKDKDRKGKTAVPDETESLRGSGRLIRLI